MSPPRVRLEFCCREGDGLWALDPGQERHLTKSLRCYEGAMIEGLLQEGDGLKLLMRLEKIDGRRLLRAVEPIKQERAGPEVTLLIGLLKADQFDSVLRASSELGISAVHPVMCERSVPRIGDELPRKMIRWRRILDESSKVSGFVCATKISPPKALCDFDWANVPDERYAAMLAASTRPISGVSPKGDVAFAVGPEGDWTDSEMSVLLKKNFVPLSLGPGILRSSTAAIVGCGWLRMSCTA
ncbi:MAG: 16S rRNA (uracil(1498)-N(3))-methyltransferase [Synergistaceae bacterium]|nr:16S rRNA (uracil(1498)-N(3))-methyltransferase [Synergistaceae bacterium]